MSKSPLCADHGMFCLFCSFGTEWVRRCFKLKIYELAKEATKDGKNMQCYIDNIPCVLYDDKFDLCAYVADKPALLEIDTVLDYKQANKENDNEKNS